MPKARKPARDRALALSWPRYALGAALALPLLAWGAFAWNYGAATPCRANVLAVEAYMRAEVERGLARMNRRPGAGEEAVMQMLMRDAEARVASMSQLECWDDLRHAQWGEGG